ncbi:efflux RND transporter periplasmic adaptor subunit [Hoeflea prorocentri]|uniref:Efflux RND transporter periplasmic adaptor subunit n=1 Tax=Hoeflea prorocentri TaxID=1922333 RepID=A0A9X3ZJ85_9HYPH|nr:efflux RND transporter periplasmic adaptor subunit [Hoeflea prorocentri]MCY6382545.1 efflux RND transporter periplasmic adaptor subunit [Hoeflea prorocentri]MDA5400345.1 efflux RND transporter periplasmic adaptor subunit [Hoeflea prorocentri]
MLKSAHDGEAAQSHTDDDAAPVEMSPRSPLLSGGRVLLQVIVMLAVLGGSYAVMNRLIATGPERTPRPFQPTVYSIETVVAEQAVNTPQLMLYGEVQAARSVELRPLVNGEIIAVNPELKAGSYVAGGDVLIEIDAFSYRGALSEARANLAQARATLAETKARMVSEQEQLEASEMQLTLAESDLERAESLVASGTLTEKQVEDRRLIVSQREQAVSQRRNNRIIEEARQEQQEANIESLEWKVQQAERNLEYTELKAPFSGVVQTHNAEPGRYVSSNDVVASLYDDNALEVRFTLTDAQYGRISTDADPLIGRAIKVVWTVGVSSYEYVGRIDRIAAEIASQRGGVEVVARLEPSDSPVQLRPGAFVEIDVPDRTYEDSLRIPETALFSGSEVFVVEDGKLVRRVVEIAAFDREDIIVTGGIEPGEIVMTTHLTQADDGVRVRQSAGETDDANGRARPEAAEGS